MSQLTELRSVTQALADAVNPATRKLADYQHALAPTDAALWAELETLAAVAAETRSSWEALRARYGPGEADDPPALRKKLNARDATIRAALRTFDETPGKLARLRTKIAEPREDFLGKYSLAACLDEVRREAATLLGRAAPLRGELAGMPAMTAAIDALTAELLEQARRGLLQAEPHRGSVLIPADSPPALKFAAEDHDAWGNPL